MRGSRNNNKQIVMSREIFILGNVMVGKKKGSCWAGVLAMRKNIRNKQNQFHIRVLIYDIAMQTLTL